MKGLGVQQLANLARLQRLMKRVKEAQLGDDDLIAMANEPGATDTEVLIAVAELLSRRPWTVEGKLQEGLFAPLPDWAVLTALGVSLFSERVLNERSES